MTMQSNSNSDAGMPVADRGGALRVLYWIAFTCSVILSAVQTVLYFLYYDEDAYVYEYGLWQPTVLHISILAVAVGLFVAGWIVSKRESHLVALAVPDRKITFFALLCGFFFAASVLIRIIYTASGLEQQTNILRMLSLIAAIPAAAYFLIMALHAVPPRTLTAVCGFFVVIWAALNTFYQYFDQTTPHASPVRQMVYVMLICVMFFYVLELRIMLRVARPRRYLAVGFSIMPVLATGSISNAVMALVGRRSLGADAVFPFIILCLNCYLFARMYSVCCGRAAREPAAFADKSIQNEIPSEENK